MNPIAVVICNYNKKGYVLDCIESVFASNFTAFDLIVVDNASTDGSVEAIRERFGDKLTLLVNEENTGGSGGFNRGMQYAMDKDCYKYIHLLDNDVIIDKDAIVALYEFMENHSDAGACGSLVCRMQARDFIQDYGANIDLEHLSVSPINGGEKISDSLYDYVVCDYIAACSAIYRIDTLKTTGIMDKDYFIYWDDIALSCEIRTIGYKIYACKKSVVWHCESQGNRNAFSKYYTLRNKIHYFTKYLSNFEYEKFCEILVKMMFRTFTVNRNNPVSIQNYFHALNDALNDIRGKAEDYKVASSENINDKLKNALANKTKILILYDNNVAEVDRIADKIKSVAEAKIYIFTGGFEVAQIDGVEYVDKAEYENYDAVIKLCYHILDEKSYDHTKIYIDKYANQIVDEEDFEFYENYEKFYGFFRDVFFGFVKSKLDVLRSKIYKGAETND